jgi:hypothetical protein
MSGYVLSLVCLVSARGLLYQSKPSIEALDASTRIGRRKASGDKNLHGTTVTMGRTSVTLRSRFDHLPKYLVKRGDAPHYVIRNGPARRDIRAMFATRGRRSTETSSELPLRSGSSPGRRVLGGWRTEPAAE